MMLFDLINMSDAYTFRADDLECAALATILLGSGQYGAKQLDGEASVPFFMLGGAEEWFRENFGRSVDKLITLFKTERVDELIACLTGVLIGNADDRDEYERTRPLIAPDKIEKWTAERHDRKRSSMNDIGARAKLIAKALAKGEPAERAPQQVFAR